jgi:hypothetical protein
VVFFVVDRDGQETTNVNVEVPEANAPDLDVPENVDVNVRTPEGGSQ